MSARLDILQKSLVKKNERLDALFNSHFSSVKSANGQPLNDKRNGQATLDKWDKQDEMIRNQKESIHKTLRAIEIEETKIKRVDDFEIPTYLTAYIESGEITQWRKHPRMFFVKDGGKARIVLLKDGSGIGYRGFDKSSSEERVIFAKTYNEIQKAIK